MVRGQNTDIMVFIRGVSSMRSGNEPLFVLDGHQLGNSYSDASRLVDMSDVQKIEVLNSLDGSSMFGLRGNNGVILITTKN